MGGVLMKSMTRIVACLVVFALLAVAYRPAESCPFCSAPSLTLSEQIAQSDAIVLVQWVSGNMTEGQSAGDTTYEIVKVVKQPGDMPAKDAKTATKEAPATADTNAVASDTTGSGPGTGATTTTVEKPTDAEQPAGADSKPTNTSTKSETVLHAGDHITLARYRAGKPGDLFLLMGTKGTVIEWSSPLEVTEASFQYIIQAPSPETATAQRLKYFVKFLEFPDPMVATDAYGEFANAPYKDIAQLSQDLPREKIRKWVADPSTPPTRMGLYGLLLGLCGDDEDAKVMAEKIRQDSQDFRLGIDGVISGYLLLTGAKGLDVIDETKLMNKKAPFSETYAAMQALRFMWTYADAKIDKERLRASMRTLLDRPELADLVIADLARWEDWSVQDRLMELYGTDGYDVPSVKTAIVCYMLVSTRQKPGNDEPAPARVAKGQAHLKALRERDPQTVARAEKVPL